MLSLFAALVLAAALPAQAQQAENVRVIGWLTPAAEPSARERGFREELRALGWVEGQNLRIEFRRAANDSGRLAQMAEELVRLKVDIIAAQSTPAVQAAKNATRTIPIVMSAAADPLGSGFVESLARAGGNITGPSMMMPELAGKRLELLRELLPKFMRVAFLAHGGDPALKLFVPQTQDAGRRLGVQVLVVERAEEFEGAFYYGPDTRPYYPRAAVYVDRILRGANPAELPVEQPQRFELVVNTKTAQRLGFGVPRSVLLRADRVIE